ncbi:MAG: hypothetical protein JXR97_17285, partial [Planctomycetes bacterium]|nr:hypothetical protein [Planctomycetota bacterium]
FSMRHGDGVAAGMLAACHFAEITGKASSCVREKLCSVLGKLGLPLKAPAYDSAAVLDSMYGDKKTQGSVMRLVIVTEPGKAEIVKQEDTAPVLEAIRLASE